MTQHPSVGLPFKEPPPPTPMRTMDPYALCWCRSGKKFKWCHKDRDKQSPDNLYDRLAQMRDAFQKGYCSHPEAPKGCSEEIVRAHTVQRRGGLAAIAENGHVVSTLSAGQDLFKNEGEFIPREVGVGSASTFFGFCGHHDSSMFKPIESGTVTLDAEGIFLLSFRSVAYELFMKRVQLNALAINRDADKGAPFEMQCEIQGQLHYTEAGARLGLQDLEDLKSKYDAAYLHRAYAPLRYFGVVFESVLPVAGSGCFHPEYDFAGHQLQRLGRGSLDYELVAINITAIAGRTAAVIAWMGSSDGPAAQFAGSYADLPNDQKAEAAVRMAFEHSENVYMRPSWWTSLSKDLKDAAIRRMTTGSPYRPEREASCLQSDGRIYVSAIGVWETLSSD